MGQNYSNQIPLTIIAEGSLEPKPEDLRWDDSQAMEYNFGFAIFGLTKLIRNSNSPDSQINIYERSFIDHLVFAEALNKWYGNAHRYTEVIDAFKTFFGFYLPRIDGIIVCNSNAETAIKRGSTNPRELLQLLSEGYKEFPASLSKITRGSEIDPRITINLNLEELRYPIFTLQPSY